jgi:hypothetical protein
MEPSPTAALSLLPLVVVVVVGKPLIKLFLPTVYQT